MIPKYQLLDVVHKLADPHFSRDLRNMMSQNCENEWH